MDPQKPSDPSSDKSEEAPKLNETGAGDAASTPAQDMPPTPSETPSMGDMTPDTPSAPDMSSPASQPVLGLSPTPKKKGLVMGLIVGAAVLVIGGGAAAAYFGYIVPNKPENILKTALGNTFGGSKVTSMYTDGSVAITDKTSTDAPTVTTTLTGKANNQGAFDMTVGIDILVTKLSLEVRSVDGSSFFVKASGLSDLTQLLDAAGDTADAKVAGPLLNKVDDQWYEINQSFLKQLGLTSTSTKLSDADKQKLGDLYKQHPFLTVKDKLPNDTIKGMDSYHLEVVLNKTELQAYLQGVADANIKALETSKSSVTDLKKQLSDITVDFNKYPIQVWIAKDQKLIDQVQLKVSNSSVDVNARLTFYDYNKPVSFTKPSGAKSVVDLLNDVKSAVPTFNPDSLNNQLLMNSVQSSVMSL